MALDSMILNAVSFLAFQTTIEFILFYHFLHIIGDTIKIFKIISQTQNMQNSLEQIHINKILINKYNNLFRNLFKPMIKEAFKLLAKFAL